MQNSWKSLSFAVGQLGKAISPARESLSLLFRERVGYMYMNIYIYLCIYECVYTICGFLAGPRFACRHHSCKTLFFLSLFLPISKCFAHTLRFVHTCVQQREKRGEFRDKLTCFFFYKCFKVFENTFSAAKTLFIFCKFGCNYRKYNLIFFKKMKLSLSVFLMHMRVYICRQKSLHARNNE